MTCAKRPKGKGTRASGAWGGPGDKCTIYGVEILWPVILIQVGMLRRAMAFVPTSRLEQAIMFELENVVEAALRKAIPAHADEILETTWLVSAGPYEDLEANIDGRCLYFIKLAQGPIGCASRGYAQL